MKRLKKLRTRVFETLRKNSLRFFSTSLLIVTEGCLTAHHNRHTQKHNNSDGEEEDVDDFDDDDVDDDEQLDEEFDEDEDEDFEDAEDELVDDDSILDKHHNDEGILSESETDKSNDTLFNEDENSSSLDCLNRDSSKLSTNNTGSPQSTTVESGYVTKHFVCNRDHRRMSPLKGPEFDVRMIDFAHTSFSSNSATDGFLLGLDNLIRLLTNIIQGGHKSSSISKLSQTNSVSNPTNPNHNKKRRRSSQMENHHQHHHLKGSTTKKKETNKKCSMQEIPSSIKKEMLETFLLNEETVMDPFKKLHIELIN